MKTQYARDKQAVVLGDASSGIRIDYVKRHRMLRISGWYDHMVGIEGHDIDLESFLEALDIPAADLRRLLKNGYGTTYA